MEKYQIIPRKFRPKRFSEVASHDAIVTTLKNALTMNRVGQAYLFCGARGSGKTTLARLFAKALNCAKPINGEPCNACIQCQEISEGRSLDVIEIDGASNRGIDDIRQINETVGYVPNKGKYKIYIIDEVHMLTKEAFNALLKTLEEPPKSVKFFFATTEPHKLPQTIVSRCQRFNLGRLSENAILEKLKRICSELNVKTEENGLIQISRMAEGSLRDAESLLDQLICFGKTPITEGAVREVFGLISKDILNELDGAISSQNIGAVMEIARVLYESGRDIGALLDSFLEHFRSYLFAPSSPFTKQECLNILDIVLDWQQRMHKSPFQRIHLEMLLIHIVRNYKKIPLDALLKRLFELEQKIGEQEAQTQFLVAEPIETLRASEAIEEKYRNHLKNREFDKEASQNSSLERVTIAREQGTSENKNFVKEAPPSKTDSSGNFGIKPLEETVHPSKYATLLHFAAIELDGTLLKP